MVQMKQGDVDDMSIADDERIQLTQLKKDFSKQRISKVQLNDALFSKCNFTEADFFGDTYSKSEFNNCDFTKANITDTSFFECGFNESTFDNATLNRVLFKDCKIINCTFKDTQLKDVTGLQDKDMKVIQQDDEQTSSNEDFSTTIESFGFKKDQQGSYSIKSNDEYYTLSIYKDPQKNQNIWEIGLFIGEQPTLTDDIDISDKNNLSEIISNYLNKVNQTISKKFQQIKSKIING